MGSRFDITVGAQNAKEGLRYIDMAIGEITRIEEMISSWDNASQTFAINQNVGSKPVKVDRELYELIERAINIYRLT
ncbi:MAG: thiamine biosynthesis lipoprotein [Saprospiraceae bacterium]|jgi:thiamine biosynthesis lipoprotein